jgi:hypothetical protein
MEDAIEKRYTMLADADCCLSCGGRLRKAMSPQVRFALISAADGEQRR